MLTVLAPRVPPGELIWTLHHWSSLLSKIIYTPVSSGFLGVCREIFPYLVVVIGLENVLVLTKSVVSTPVDLEVKLRIAQGEEWGVGDLGLHAALIPNMAVFSCRS